MLKGAERRHASTLLALVVFLVSLAAFAIVASFDPDPHHDGFQFGVAVGVLDGRPVYQGVFDQYGPSTAWLQALALRAFGPHLVVLRYEIALVLALVAAQIAWIVQRHTRSRVLAATAAAGWVLACPVWASYEGQFPLWPWPSAVLAMCLLGCVIAYESGCAGRRSSMVMAGVLVGVSFFTRWPSGVALVAVFCVCFALFPPVRDRLKLTVAWCSGLIAAIAAGTVVLLGEHSLDAAIFETVTYPASVYTQWSGVGWFVLYYGYGGVAFAVIAVTSVVAFSVRMPMPIRLLSGLGLIVSAVAVYWVGSAKVPAEHARALGIPESVVGAADVVGESIPIIAAVGVIPLALLLLVGYRGHVRALAPVAALGGVAMTSLVQLYPIADVYHLWWAVPPCVAFGVVAVQRRFSRHQRYLRILAVVIAVPFFGLAIVKFYNVTTTPRVSIGTGVLAQMKVLPSRVAGVSTLDSVLLTEPALSSREFACSDGLVSVYTGEYRPSTAAFVNWAWLPPGAPVPTGKGPIVVCAPDLATGMAWARTWGRVVVAGSRQPVMLSQWSSFVLLVMEQRHEASTNVVKELP